MPRAVIRAGPALDTVDGQAAFLEVLDGPESRFLPGLEFAVNFQHGRDINVPSPGSISGISHSLPAFPP